MEAQNLKQIRETIKEFFEKSTFEVEMEIGLQEGSALPINIKTDEPQILIGQGGQTLFEIQHILRAILRKKIGQALLYIDLDINDYKKKKIDYLKELARSAADDVSLTKQERALDPMSAYERRVIHLELASRGDIIAESAGQEPERRIVIKPHP